MLIKTSYFEPLRDVESDFKFVQFFLYTLYNHVKLKTLESTKRWGLRHDIPIREFKWIYIQGVPKKAECWFGILISKQILLQ